MVTRRRLLGPAVVSALSVAVALAVAVADRQTVSRYPNAIDGPYARLLSDSADLGPARSDSIHITAALQRPAEPVSLISWAGAHGLSVRWNAGDAWAVIDGTPGAVSRAFGVEVRDYRAPDRSGQVFTASPQQPVVPVSVRTEVSGLGRILGYAPARNAMPSLPRDVPDGALRPNQLLNAYNATPLVQEGHTGKGETVVVFAFDGFDQRDMDIFADSSGLPRFTPEVIGGMPERRIGESNMDLQVIHAIAPDAKLVLANARETITPGGMGPFEDLAALMNSMDQQFPGAIWSFSIGWGCDRLFTAADFAPVREALRAAMDNGTTAFNATGDLAGLECKRGERWSEPPSEDDVGVDAVASLPEMTAVGGTKLSTDAAGNWLSEQSWYNNPLILGTAGGASTLFPRPEWQTVGIGTELPDRRLVPDVAAVSDPATGVRIVFNQKFMVGGGTSQAAPIWAGLTALMNDKLRASGAKPVGDLNPTLYKLARNSTVSPGLRDINLGGNAISVSATLGYDMVTGMGTPNVENLVKNLLLARANT